MSEIGKPEIGINTNYSTQQLGKNTPIEEKAEQQEREEIKEFNNPGADAAGRAMLMKSDSLENDMDKIIRHPKVLKYSESLYEAAKQVALANGASEADAEAIAATVATEGW